MWIQQILLGILGLSAGIIVAGGLFSFIIELGILADFADRTHTGDHVLLYEDAAALGGAVGNLVFIYQIPLPGGGQLLAVFGLLAGIFTGCWAMALAEVLNVFPVFIRRINLAKCVSWAILGMAIGKGLGALVFFWNQWGVSFCREKRREKTGRRRLTWEIKQKKMYRHTGTT